MADCQIRNPLEQPQLATGDNLSCGSFVYSCLLPFPKNTTIPKQPCKKPHLIATRADSFSCLGRQYQRYLTESLRRTPSVYAEVTTQPQGNIGVTRKCAIAGAQSLDGKAEMSSARVDVELRNNIVVYKKSMEGSIIVLYGAAAMQM